jgi:TonB family protein
MSKLSLTLCLTVLFVTTTSTLAAQVVSSTPKATDSGQQELDEAARQHSLAFKLFNEKKFDEAVSAAKRAVEIREKALGETHYLTRLSLKNLAQIYVAKQSYGEAVSIYQRLLSIYGKVFKPGTEEEINALEQIATLYFYQHKLDEAERNYLHVLELRETALGKDHLQVAHTLYQLATLYQFSGKDDQARLTYQRAVDIWEKHTETVSPEYVATLERYSCLLRRDNRVKEADEMDSRSAELIGRLNGKALQSGSDSGVEVQGGVLNGKAVSKPTPPYPPEAIALRQQGKVVVRVVVDENGRVIYACAISGASLLRDVSERAAYAARFTPTLLSGVPVKVTGIISYDFTLR